MRELSPFDVDEGSPFRAEFKGYFSKEYQPKSVPNSNEFSENPS